MKVSIVTIGDEILIGQAGQNLYQEDQEHKFQLLEIGLKNFANTKEHPYKPILF